MIIEEVRSQNGKLYVTSRTPFLPPDDAPMFIQGRPDVDATRWSIERIERFEENLCLFGPITKLDGPLELRVGEDVHLVDGMPC